MSTASRDREVGGRYLAFLEAARAVLLTLSRILDDPNDAFARAHHVGAMTALEGAVPSTIDAGKIGAPAAIANDAAARLRQFAHGADLEGFRKALGELEGALHQWPGGVIDGAQATPQPALLFPSIGQIRELTSLWDKLWNLDSYVEGTTWAQEDKYLVVFGALADLSRSLGGLYFRAEGWPEEVDMSCRQLVASFHVLSENLGWDGLLVPEPERSAEVTRRRHAFTARIEPRIMEAALAIRTGWAYPTMVQPDVAKWVKLAQQRGFRATPGMMPEEGSRQYIEEMRRLSRDPTLGIRSPSLDALGATADTGLRREILGAKGILERAAREMALDQERLTGATSRPDVGPSPADRPAATSRVVAPCPPDDPAGPLLDRLCRDLDGTIRAFGVGGLSRFKAVPAVGRWGDSGQDRWLEWTGAQLFRDPGGRWIIEEHPHGALRYREIETGEALAWFEGQCGYMHLRWDDPGRPVSVFVWAIVNAPFPPELLADHDRRTVREGPSTFPSPAAPARPQKRGRPGADSPLRLDDRAVALLTRWIKEGVPKISQNKIAKALPCHHSSLRHCPTFLALWRSHLQQTRRGFRSAKTGDIEAIDDD